MSDSSLFYTGFPSGFVDGVKVDLALSIGRSICAGFDDIVCPIDLLAPTSSMSICELCDGGFLLITLEGPPVLYNFLSL